MIRQLVVFGASGDLTGRYLLPAVARLHAAEEALPEPLAIIGVDREDWDDESFRRHAAARTKASRRSTPRW